MKRQKKGTHTRGVFMVTKRRMTVQRCKQKCRIKMPFWGYQGYDHHKPLYILEKGGVRVAQTKIPQKNKIFSCNRNNSNNVFFFIGFYGHRCMVFA